MHLLYLSEKMYHQLSQDAATATSLALSRKVNGQIIQMHLHYYTNGWNFIDAVEGMTVWVSSARCHYTYDGAKWVPSFSISASSYPSLAQNDTAETELDAY
jgi:Protein of unknown function (DUF2793)